MAESSEKKPAGMMPALLALVVVGAMGFGAGIGMRMAFDDPEAAAKAETKAKPGKEAKAEDAHSKPKEAKSAAKGEGEHPAEEGAEEDKLEEPEADNLAELVATPIDPVITNLGNPKEVWIRLEGSILSRIDAEVPPKTLAVQAQHQILSYLRTIDSRQIEGASGLLHLNEDLNEVMKTFSGGQVRQLLISGLILE